MDSKRSRVLLAPAASAASALMLFYGSGIHPHWWLMWIAMLPVLIVAPRLRAWPAFAVAAFAWAIGGVNQWSYLRTVGVPAGAITGVIIIPALLFGLAVLLNGVYTRRGALWRAALTLPAVWVTCEFLNNLASIHGTFGNIAYTRLDFLPILQLAPVFGIWGIDFCLVFFAAVLALLTLDAPHRARFAAGVLACALIVIGFGEWRLHSGPSYDHAIEAGLLSSDYQGNDNPESPKAHGRLLREYLDHVNELVTRGAQVVMTPETLAAVLSPLTEDIDSLYQHTADSTQVPILIGVIRKTPDTLLNEARLYLPAASAPLTYEKHHMLPPFESDMLVGTTRLVFDQPSGKWGVAICKDMDFPELSRQYDNDGIGLLLVPAWDFDVDAWLHDRMAILRGVESGFSIARTAKNGLLTITDDRGRVLAESSSASAPFASLLARVPVHHDATFYAEYGDWFGWLNVLGMAVLIAGLWRRN